MLKLSMTTTLMEQFTEDIRMRKSRIIVKMAEHQDFKTTLDLFEKWLKRTEKTIDGQKQISPVPDEINTQMLKIEVICFTSIC